LLWGGILFSQDYNTTKGIIKDSLSSEALPYATIRFSKKHTGAISNRDGEFSISSNIDSLSISYVGYKTKKIKLKPNNYNTIYLSSDISNISEVIITSYSEKDYLILFTRL